VSPFRPWPFPRPQTRDPRPGLPRVDTSLPPLL
jgi:hypothetical protein